MKLSDLPDGHPALEYLRARGYDPVELSTLWDIHYCTKALPGYPLAQDRLIIPVIKKGIWVGWQGRYVGERNWKMERLPKYFTMPTMPKRHFLYNEDLAKEQPCVVVCEGSSDVWRVGPAGVALLGKQASLQQMQLLLKEWPNKPIVVLLDGDAPYEADQLCKQLKPLARGGLVKVTLSYGRDPGKTDRQELWALIRAQAEKQEIAFPAMEVARQPAPC